MRTKIQQEPKFIPEPGQVDYTNIRYAPVVNSVVQYKDKVLIVKRNRNLKTYPGLWNGVGGYLDDDKSVEEKVKEELKEELGIDGSDIISIERGQVFDYDEPKYNKTWIIFPVLARVKSDRIKLDWEAEDYKWIKPNDIKDYKIVSSFDKVLAAFFKI